MIDTAKLSREEWENLIYQRIHNETYRKIISRRWLDGVKQEDLAEEFGYSVHKFRI
jgi:hypothetical protein